MDVRLRLSRSPRARWGRRAAAFIGTGGGINQGAGDSVGGGIEPDLGLCNAAAYLGCSFQCWLAGFGYARR